MAGVPFVFDSNQMSSPLSQPSSSSMASGSKPRRSNAQQSSSCSSAPSWRRDLSPLNLDAFEMFGDGNQSKRRRKQVPSIVLAQEADFDRFIIVDPLNPRRSTKGKAPMRTQRATVAPTDSPPTPPAAPLPGIYETPSRENAIMRGPPSRFVPALNLSSIQRVNLPDRCDPETCESATVAPDSLQLRTSYADVVSVELRREGMPQLVSDTFAQIKTLRKECLDVMVHSIALPPASSYHSMLQYLYNKWDLPRGDLTTTLVYPGRRPQAWYHALLRDRFLFLEEREIKTGEEAILEVKLGLLLESMRHLIAGTSEQQLWTWWKVMVLPLELPTRFRNGFTTYRPNDFR